MNTRDIIAQAGTPTRGGLVYKKEENYQVAHNIGYNLVEDFENVEEDN